ncbi:MAG: hypothetical protein JOZ66_15265 [Hyphomicrobiales bacterium]|nr:hypothetical protein [Hyphomicrobiales bacterium]
MKSETIGRFLLECLCGCVLLAAAPSPVGAAGPFDGNWQVVVECAASADGAKGYRWVFPATVRNGELVGVYNQPTRVPSGHLVGRIGQDGSAQLTMTGRTGDPAYTINRAPGGSPIRYSVTAHFSGDSGSGTRNEQRSCSLAFSRS